MISDALLNVMRPDQRDDEGTGITVKVARGLQVPRLLSVLNKAPPVLDPEAVGARVRQVYGREDAAVLPHSAEMMNPASEGIFVLRYPGTPLPALDRRVAAPG